MHLGIISLSSNWRHIAHWGTRVGDRSLSYPIGSVRTHVRGGTGVVIEMDGCDGCVARDRRIGDLELALRMVGTLAAEATGRAVHGEEVVASGGVERRISLDRSDN